MIFSEPRDPRLITIRRGGSLTDDHHHLLALWAATCAEHVLHLFEEAQPSDSRPRHAIEQARAWTRGELTMSQARAAGGHASSAQPPTRSRPRARLRLKARARGPAGSSAAGSANSSPMQFANLCLMINDDAMTCAGLYLLVNQPAERRTPLLLGLTCVQIQAPQERVHQSALRGIGVRRS